MKKTGDGLDFTDARAETHPPGGVLKVRVIDEAGKPLPARVHLRDAEGSYLLVPGQTTRQSAVYQGTQPVAGDWFYTDGSFSIDVGAGETQIDIAHGPAYATVHDAIPIVDRSQERMAGGAVPRPRGEPQPLARLCTGPHQSLLRDRGRPPIRSPEDARYFHDRFSAFVEQSLPRVRNEHIRRILESKCRDALAMYAAQAEFEEDKPKP
ncbi:MAG: hypothetical protein ACYC6Y_27705 [Thermoguttaceae bacterium]